MSFKIGSDIVYVANERSGLFTNVYYQSITYNLVLTNGFIGGADAWFNPNGDAKFSQVEAINAYQYSQISARNYGYASGGSGPIFVVLDSIQRFPFASLGNSSAVGSLTFATNDAVGQSSSTHGYTCGGISPSSPAPGTTSAIDRFPFAQESTAAGVGNMTVRRDRFSSQMSYTHGYSTGGQGLTPRISTIDRFSFASGGNAIGVGNLGSAVVMAVGQSSVYDGYSCGGAIATPAYTTVIQRFPFAAEFADSANVGNIVARRDDIAGMSSAEHGYIAGGSSGSFSNAIERFAFVNTVEFAFTGTLAVARSDMASQSSLTHGYNCGGNAPALSSVIDRFSFFANAAPSSSVGNLPGGRYKMHGHQV